MRTKPAPAGYEIGTTRHPLMTFVSERLDGETLAGRLLRLDIQAVTHA